MKLKLIAALSIATAAAVPFAAIANACGGRGDFPADYEFVTPSGNIVCDMYADNSGANCEVREHTWVAPASTGQTSEPRLRRGGQQVRCAGPEDTRLRPDRLAVRRDKQVRSKQACARPQ